MNFLTALGERWVSILTAGMPYLDPTYGGSVATATDAKSVFALGLMPTPSVVITLAGMSPVGNPSTVGAAVQQMRMTWRAYIVGANFNRATAPGRVGELGQPGTDQMIADMIATCHGKFIIQNPTADLQAARLFPGSLSWLDDSNDKIIYQFDWHHTWPLVEND